MDDNFKSVLSPEFRERVREACPANQANKYLNHAEEAAKTGVVVGSYVGVAVAGVVAATTEGAGIAVGGGITAMFSYTGGTVGAGIGALASLNYPPEARNGCVQDFIAHEVYEQSAPQTPAQSSDPKFTKTR